MQNKTIMIIPGGKFQVPLVKKAKQMGIKTVVTDASEDAPCKEYADIFEAASALDVEKNLIIARRYNVDAVLTDQTDTAVKTVAHLNEELGLHGIGRAAAELFTNKVKMREFCRDNGFPHPKFKLCYTAYEARNFAENESGYPFIIKPIDNQSSKGVYLIHDLDELESSLEVSRGYSISANAVLAEEYLDGQEFTADGIKGYDSAQTLAISRKSMYANNAAVAKSLLFTNNDDYGKLRAENEKLITAMGLPFGLTHAEYRFFNGKYYLLEIAARGGGTELASCIVPEMSGIDNYKSLINLSLGMPIENFNQKSDVELKNKAMLLEFFDIAPGVVKTLSGMDKIRKLPYVKNAVLNFSAGSVVQPVSNDTARAGYYIISGNSVSELNSRRNELLSILEVEYEACV